MTLAFFDPTSGNLSACIGMISMVEDEQAVISFDVDDDAISHCHRQIVSVSRREARLGQCSGMSHEPGPDGEGRG